MKKPPETTLNALRETQRSLPMALLRARETVMAPIREMLAEAGVTEQQWRVLRVLEEAGPTETTVLARQASLLAPSLTRMVQTLVKKELVTRRPDQSDARRQVIDIAPSGRAMLAAYRDEAQAIALDLEERFGRRRLEQLLDLLNALDDLEMSSPREP